MTKSQKNRDSQILSRIYGHGRGWVFTPNHFKDLGSRDAIASALKRSKQAYRLLTSMKESAQIKQIGSKKGAVYERAWSDMLEFMLAAQIYALIYASAHKFVYSKRHPKK